MLRAVVAIGECIVQHTTSGGYSKVYIN